MPMRCALPPPPRPPPVDPSAAAGAAAAWLHGVPRAHPSAHLGCRLPEAMRARLRHTCFWTWAWCAHRAGPCLQEHAVQPPAAVAAEPRPHYPHASMLGAPHMNASAHPPPLAGGVRQAGPRPRAAGGRGRQGGDHSGALGRLQRQAGRAGAALLPPAAAALLARRQHGWCLVRPCWTCQPGQTHTLPLASTRALQCQDVPTLTKLLQAGVACARVDLSCAWCCCCSPRRRAGLRRG